MGSQEFWKPLLTGFHSYLKNPAFEHIRARNGIIATYDFVKKKSNTDHGLYHGTNVFSCIGGQAGNIPIGLASGAEFLLARTENITEFFKEEEKVISLYAEAKKNYPLLSELMENKRPYLKDMLAEAKRLYEKEILGK